MDQIVSTALPAVLALIEQLSGTGGLALPGIVTKILDVVAPLVPLAIKEVQTMGPVLRNIIVGLRQASPSDADWERLVALEDQLDQAWAAARAAR